MDFFQAQERARRSTSWLVVYFVAAVLGTIAVIYLVFAIVFAAKGHRQEGIQWDKVWNPSLLLWVAGGTSAVVLIGSLTKMSELHSGGGVVARSLGGRLVDHSTNDPDERKLVNVVEEMAIASGIPVPEIYVLHGEENINAFAAGNSVSDAAVGVTRGCIQLLNRDELQGVIAHEFSHILNGDMRLNIRLMGVVHGILCIAIIGRVLLMTSTRRRYYYLGARNDSKGGNPLPFIGLVLFAVGYIGVFFGHLIKSAISRQREFLADASAVQFTRNPGGISNALKKIGGIGRAGSRLHSPNAEEASHMFFGNALAQGFLNITATHPPLDVRIRAIDPSFDGTYPDLTVALQEIREHRPPPQGEPGYPGRKRPTPPPIPPILPVPPPLAAGNVINQVGTIQPQNVVWALALMAEMPEPLRVAARDAYGARALIYALLLNEDAEPRGKQMSALQAQADPGVLAELQKLLKHIGGLKQEARLPLVEMAISSLRRMSQSQFETFLQNVETLIAADQQIDLFEYSLQRMLKRHLWPHYRKQKPVITQYYALNPLLPDCEVLLSGLANIGSSSPEAVTAAFRAGISRLGNEGAGLKLLPLAQANLPQIDAALDRLATGSPLIKKQVLDACAYAVASDGEIQAREAELLRAVADGLDCPLPPMLQTKE